MVSDGNIPPDQGSGYGTSRAAADEPDSLNDVGHYLNEAREQAFRYLTAQAERIRAMVRSAALFGILGIAAAFVGLTIVIAATVLACVGIAGGIAQLLGGRQWAGDLITGGGILAVLGIGGFIFVQRIIKAARKKTVASWAERKTRGPMS
jgi:hypothetical protein